MTPNTRSTITEVLRVVATAAIIIFFLYATTQNRLRITIHEQRLNFADSSRVTNADVLRVFLSRSASLDSISARLLRIEKEIENE